MIEWRVRKFGSGGERHELDRNRRILVQGCGGKLCLFVGERTDGNHRFSITDEFRKGLSNIVEDQRVHRQSPKLGGSAGERRSRRIQHVHCNFGGGYTFGFQPIASILGNAARAEQSNNQTGFHLYLPAHSSGRSYEFALISYADRGATARAPARKATSDQTQQLEIPGFRFRKAGGSRTEQANRQRVRPRRRSNGSVWESLPLYVLDTFRSRPDLIPLALDDRRPHRTFAVDQSCYYFQNFPELDSRSPVFSAAAIQDAICCCSWPAMNPIASAFSACFLERLRGCAIVTARRL